MEKVTFANDYKNPERVQSKSKAEHSDCSALIALCGSSKISTSLKTTECSNFVQEWTEELRDKQKKLGYDHPDVADTLNMLGLYHHHVTNDQCAALRFHKQALHILEISQRKCPDFKFQWSIGVTLTDVGNVLKCLGEHAKAMNAYENALSTFKDLGLKEDHPRVLSTKRCIKRINRHWKAQNLVSLNSM